MKVGDKVRVIGGYWRNGEIGKVISVDQYGWVCVQFVDGKCFFHSSELEVIEEKESILEESVGG